MPYSTVLRPIALLTDFGHTDAFVGILKGVILSIHPEARIVDLCHGVSHQDIGHGAHLLDISLDYFPRGTIFCAVVDPGVGTTRRAVLVETRDYFLVGPDNGMLWPAASRNNICRVIHLTRSRYFLPRVSATFHGRDIFAPVAAHLSAGIDPGAFGPEVSGLTRFAFTEPEPFEDGLILSIRHIDTFGNVGLNLTLEQFMPFVEHGFLMQINQTKINRYYDTYAAAPEKTFFVIADSAGFVEIAIKNGHAASQLDVDKQDTDVTVTIEPMQ
ncbi:MAG: S-adenosyl-l-methionine hydroxide adenosyltransferase family protein [Desulfotignum sp.]